MTHATHLSPAYGLSLIRLAGPEPQPPWPGLLLHSRSLSWAFDELAQPLRDPGEAAQHAGTAGLYLVEDPFRPELQAADPPWIFRLPSRRRTAQLMRDDGLTVEFNRQPLITDDWWRMAVSHGGHCRLLVAVCVDFPDDPGAAGDVLNEAAADARVHGATINVEF